MKSRKHRLTRSVQDVLGVAFVSFVLTGTGSFLGCNKASITGGPQDSPADALQRFYANEGPEDTLMDPLILAGDRVVPVVLKEVKDKNMPRRRYAIGFLGNGFYKEALTTTYTGLAAKTISYAYYPDGSRETMTTPAGTFNYSYDAGGRPSSMTNPFNETTAWAYLNNGWLQSQTLANGATANYTHNAMGQVTRLLNQIGGNTISDFSSIAYDGVGNRSSITASVRQVIYPKGHSGNRTSIAPSILAHRN